MAVIALDVGGSSVKHGRIDLDQLTTFTIQTTPIDSLGSADAIIGTLADIVQAYPPDDIAFGFPGPFDYATGVSYITGLEKYESLYGLNIADRLRQALGQPERRIRFRNDAEAAIMGEAIYGSGVSCRRIIGVTLGTGFGSAFVADGESVVSGEGVPENGWLYPFTFNGVRSDDAFSTRGLLDRFQAAGVHVSSVTAVDETDPQVRRVFSAYGHDMGQFLKPFAQAFRADCVIVLGGISGAFALFSTELAAALAPVQVIKGQLETRAALLGAAHLFWRETS